MGPPAPRRRRPTQTPGGTVYLLAVAVAVAGVAVAAVGPWRTGVTVLGCALLLAALTRAVLGERAAGMLRIRRRVTDVLMLAAGGVALVVLAVVVPNQPPR